MLNFRRLSQAGLLILANHISGAISADAIDNAYRLCDMLQSSDMSL